MAARSATRSILSPPAILTSNIGIENPAPSVAAIHDHTDQGKFFGYASTLVGDGGRFSFISGTAVGNYQIPNNPGQPQAFSLPGQDGFTSSQVNEHQLEQNYFNVAAFQQTLGAVDYQISAFSRYSSLAFTPDPIGDLLFNGVASTVFRSSFLNGIQEDTAIKLNDQHTLRVGFTGSGEVAQASNASIVFPVDAGGNVDGPPFAAPTDVEQQDRLAVRRLCAGRMEDQQPADTQRRPAFRPDVRIYRRQPAQPAHQPDL